MKEKGFEPLDQRNLGPATEETDIEDLLYQSKREAMGANFSDAPPPGIPTQIRMIFRRDLLDMKRNKNVLIARFGITAFLSMLMGVIFLDVGSTDRSVPINLQSQFGVVVMVALLSLFGTGQPALISFPEERPVFIREYSTHHYSVLGYFLSRMVNELLLTAIQTFLQCVIVFYMTGLHSRFSYFFLVNYAIGMASTAVALLLGSSITVTKVASEMLPVIMVPQILFSGFFIAPSLMPSWLRWAQYICTLTYGVRILMVEEFEDCNPRDAVENDACNNLLEDIDADPSEVYWYWLVLLAFFSVFRLLAFYSLRTRALQ